MRKKEVPYEFFESEVIKNKGMFVEKRIVGFTKLHTHDYYEIEFFMSGKGKYFVGEDEYSIHRGFVSLVVPGEYHQVLDEEPVLTINGSFSENYISKKSVQMINKMKSQHFFIEDEYELHRFINEFEQLIEENDISEKNDDLCRNIIERILIYCSCHGRGKEFSKKNSGKVDEAVAWVGMHFRENISLSDVAERFNYSPNYFSEIFHNIKGVSFKRYLVNKRLDCAKKILDRMDISVTDLCIECGFSDTTHFSKSFKKKYGMTPSQYRKNKDSEKNTHLL